MNEAMMESIQESCAVLHLNLTGKEFAAMVTEQSLSEETVNAMEQLLLHLREGNGKRLYRHYFVSAVCRYEILGPSITLISPLSTAKIPGNLSNYGHYPLYMRIKTLLSLALLEQERLIWHKPLVTLVAKMD